MTQLPSRLRARAALIFCCTFAIGVIACSPRVGTGAAGRGKCATRSGTFRYTYKLRNGTCGEHTEEIRTLVDQAAVLPGVCTGTPLYSEDNCEVRFDYTCTDRGYNEHGLEKWNADGTYARSDTQASVEGKCSSTYDVTIEKL